MPGHGQFMVLFCEYAVVYFCVDIYQPTKKNSFRFHWVRSGREVWEKRNIPRSWERCFMRCMSFCKMEQDRNGTR